MLSCDTFCYRLQLEWSGVVDRDELWDMPSSERHSKVVLGSARQVWVKCIVCVGHLHVCKFSNAGIGPELDLACGLTQ